MIENESPIERDILKHAFQWGSKTHIMAIVNITPNSFSGDGLSNKKNVISAALRRARRAVEDGAHILDVGGVPAFPGAPPVTEDQELNRVIPVIKALSHSLDIPISIDSYSPQVVTVALDSGAAIVNSCWGMRTPEGNWNEPLAELVARRQVPVILAHNRNGHVAVSEFGPHYSEVQYDDLMADVIRELTEAVDYAIGSGITRKQLIIDPGLGLGKTPEQNLFILRHLDAFRAFGLPLLIGASRKSFIGAVLGGPPNSRDAGTAAITALAALHRVDIVRVHSVRLNSDVARMVDALTR